MTAIPYAFRLSDEQLAQFAASPMTAVRMPLVSRATDYDWTPSNKATKNLVAASTCFTQQ